MSTNYYVKSNFCDCCGRYEREHICKSLTMFEARRVRDEENDRDLIECGSWTEWKEYLQTPEVHEVYDEYGKILPVEQFIALVEGVSLKDRVHHFQYMAENHPRDVSDGPELGKHWQDEDGYMFSGMEFS